MEPEPSPSPSRMHVLAPAKINLHLRVGPPTPDGFHPLLTWMCTVSLFDNLTISAAASVAAVGSEAEPNWPLIRLTCDDPSLPCDGSNLIVRAGMGLAEDWGNSTREGGSGRRLEGVRIALEKRIPSGAGLGGGSSDGASAMMALNRWWGTGISAERMAAWSAAYGSDLPFFFHGGSSVCTGRGEKVRPVTPPRVARWAVLVLPGIAMPTPAVYRKFDEMGLGDSRCLDEGGDEAVDWDSWAGLPARDLLPRLVNDLEAPAFAIRPELAALRREIESTLGRPVRMSGSGSSLFTLFDDEPAARDAAGRVGAGAKAVSVEVAPRVAL